MLSDYKQMVLLELSKYDLSKYTGVEADIVLLTGNLEAARAMGYTPEHVAELIVYVIGLNPKKHS